MIPGYISLGRAASLLCRQTRGKPFRSLERLEALKLVRELQHLLVGRDVAVLIRSGADWVSLSPAERSRNFKLAFGLGLSPAQLRQNLTELGDDPDKLGAETIHNRGELRELIIREADVATLLALQPDPRGVPVTFEQLKGLGVPYDASKTLFRKVAEGFPASFMIGGKTCWWSNEIRAWVAEQVKKDSVSLKIPKDPPRQK